MYLTRTHGTVHSLECPVPRFPESVSEKAIRWSTMLEPELSVPATCTLPSKTRSEGTLDLTNTHLYWHSNEMQVSEFVHVRLVDVAGMERHRNGRKLHDTVRILLSIHDQGL